MHNKISYFKDLIFSIKQSLSLQLFEHFLLPHIFISHKFKEKGVLAS